MPGFHRNFFNQKYVLLKKLGTSYLIFQKKNVNKYIFVKVETTEEAVEVEEAVEDEPASEDDVDEDDTDAERSWKR